MGRQIDSSKVAKAQQEKSKYARVTEGNVNHYEGNIKEALRKNANKSYVCVYIYI